MSETQAGSARMWTVLLAVVLGASVVGFLIGTRTSEPATLPSRRAPDVAAVGADLTPGQNYGDLRARRFGPSSEVSSHLSKLRALLPGLKDEVVQSDELRRQAVESRAMNRAYDGAPPFVPHAVDERSADSCLACHAEGLKVKDRTAPVMSHTSMPNCLQCHASTAPRWDAEEASLANTFSGLSSSGAGGRAWEGAPPTIPHGVWMREDCHSCHGVAGRPGLRTSHPERQNCQQCHASIQELAR
ncbi:MAG: nitrate reductase cytochrome c-type subunit [Planctomycetota bacterium]